MEVEDNSCLQCHKTSYAPSNRLVQDSCGHTKCRSCLLEDIENCKQCLMTLDSNNIANGEKNCNSTIPRITDNHTAVIHCNGRAKFNTESEKLQEINHIDCKPDSKVELNNVKTKEKNEIKKRMIQFPSHVTVQTDPLSYLCTICNKTFFAKGHIKYHKYCNGELKPYKCGICNKEFILKVQLQIHMYKHNNIKPFKCNVCAKAFSEKSKLTRHMTLHSTGKNFICPNCAKSFKTKDSLRIHSFIHKNDKPFTCKVCSAKFNNSSNLRKHLVSHSNEKEHMCDQCGRRFKLKWALSVHRKSHLNVRPHSCNICYKSFVNLKDLQRHVLIHSESKSYGCGICQTTFQRKDSLLRHVKNTHPGKKADIIIKNTSKHSEFEKKSVVIDNPNAVNVITASPALSKCTPLPPSTAISTDSRPTGSVINAPIKLAFKTPAFKSNYNITRGSDFIPTSQIAKNLSLSGPIDLPSSSSAHPSDDILSRVVGISQQILSKPSQDVGESTRVIASASDLSYPSVLHYETSFQNRKHAMIKNIKFKVPERYTNSFKSNNNSFSNPSDVNCYSDASKPSEVINPSVIVNNGNSGDIHWRRRTSQNLVLKD